MRTAPVKRPPDVFAAPVFAWVRVVAIVVVSAGGAASPAESADTRLFFQLMAFAGLPVALILLATVNRLQPRTHAILSAAADVTGALSLHVLVDQGAQVARLAYVAIPAIAAITAGFLPALAVTVVGVVANAAIDLVDADSIAGDFNPVVHLGRLGLATLLVYLVARATDERRLAQASERAASVKAETILSKVTSAVVVTDRNGRVVEWNDAAATVMNIDETAGARRSCQEVLGLYAGSQPLDCANGCGLLRLRHEYPEHDVPEICRYLPDGRQQPLIAEAAPITNADGGIIEVVHSLLDVSRLKQADEAKTMFLATASHELKTPLTVISGFAELMMSMPDLPEDQRLEAVETIHRRATQLASIVDRLLLSSRIEAGTVQLNAEPVNVEPIVRDHAESLARATGRAIGVTITSPLPKAEADASAVATIIDHLLENAIRYSPADKRVDISVSADDETIEITVIDRGIGMDAEQQAHCFERFWQAESSDVRRFGGTGIGLYIVNSLVEAMRGTIAVRSTLGRGTTFTLRLPLAASLDLDSDGGAILGEVLSELHSPAPGRRS